MWKLKNDIIKLQHTKSVAEFCCISSKEQEKEGYSIPAQIKLIREYAARSGMIIVREFEDVETANRPHQF
jgi:hypothetical protein